MQGSLTVLGLTQDTMDSSRVQGKQSQRGGVGANINCMHWRDLWTPQTVLLITIGTPIVLQNLCNIFRNKRHCFCSFVSKMCPRYTKKYNSIDSFYSEDIPCLIWKWTCNVPPFLPLFLRILWVPLMVKKTGQAFSMVKLSIFCNLKIIALFKHKCRYTN